MCPRFVLLLSMINRKWDLNKAMTEAEALGLSDKPLRQFGLDYVQTHK